MSPLTWDPRWLDRASLNAWPALDHITYDGWLLRFADGYTKRANSVNAIGPSQFPLQQTIDFCEARYAERGQPTIFRLPSFLDLALDEALARRGYTVLDPTLVLARDIGRADRRGDARGRMQEAALPDWLACHARLHAADPATMGTHRRILQAMTVRRLLALWVLDGKPVACAMGAIEGDLLGLFGLIVDPTWRRRGVATALVYAMLQWGRRHKASTAYLQVVEANDPARRLYRGLGFSPAYRYRYRVRSLPPDD